MEQKESQFMKLLSTHRESVYRICWGFTASKSDVDDLFQDVMMNVWRGLDSFQGKSEWSTWIYRISVNTCLLWKRSKKRRINLDSSDSTIPDLSRETVEDDYIRSEKILKLRNAIQSLKAIDKSIALLLLEEMSYKEIADITGLTVGNVGVKINRIKEQLKKKML